MRELGLRIVGGELAPGDRLPTESILTQTCDVSRPVLREVAHVLVAKGLAALKGRQCDGVHNAR